ncbi:MAG: peroxiredoxin family protein [Gammaproteobacteria bacterium]
MKLKHGIIAFLVAAIVAAGAWVWLNLPAAPAPDVTFTTVTGKPIALKSLQGKPVLVTFWATDCPGCIEEIPHLIELYNVYHPKGLELIAVAMSYDVPSHVAAMRESKQLPYDIALDLKAEHAHAFGDVRLTPTTFLIGPDGRIQLQKIGAFDLDDMRIRIETLLQG